MFLNFNTIGMNAHRNWTMHNNKIAKALERLSSGKRINSAADDPAGLAVSEKLKFQLTLLETDKRNVMDNMSRLQLSDATLGEMNSMLGRMQELASMAANGIYSEVERHNMNSEYQQLLSEINRCGQGAAFNSKKLFENSALAGTGSQTSSGTSEKLSFQGGNLEAYLDGLDKLLSDISLAAGQGDDETLLSLGIDRSNGKTDSENLRSAVLEYTKENADRLLNTPGTGGIRGGNPFVITLSDGDITIDMPSFDNDSLGLQDTNLLSQEAARAAMDAVKKASESVSSWRGDTGAAYNRLEHAVNSISNMEENLTAALSRICDADMAKEMMILVKEQMLAQSSMFVMAQANQQPKQVLSLLKSL